MSGLQFHRVVLFAESCKGLHLGLGELEVVHIGVLLDAGRCDGLGKRDETLFENVSDAVQKQYVQRSKIQLTICKLQRIRTWAGDFPVLLTIGFNRGSSKCLPLVSGL